jgi:hypothetical protein
VLQGVGSGVGAGSEVGLLVGVIVAVGSSGVAEGEGVRVGTKLIFVGSGAGEAAQAVSQKSTNNARSDRHRPTAPLHLFTLLTRAVR